MKTTVNIATGDVEIDYNFIAPSFEEELPVKAITARQARLGLYAAGLLDEVEALISQMPRQTQLTWEYATTVERDNPLLLQMAAALSMSSDDLDNLFRQAAIL